MDSEDTDDYEKKLIGHKFMSVPDCDGEIHRFEIEIYTRGNKLIFEGIYKRNRPDILYIEFVKDDNQEYRVPEDDLSWIFELPPDIQDKGVGSRLWKKVESFFCEYHVVEIKGWMGCVGDTPDERNREIHFWEKMGFEIRPKDMLYKSYKRP